MRWFHQHKHQWVEVGREWFGVSKGFHWQPKEQWRLVGYRTLITYQCDCGKYRQETLQGHVGMPEETELSNKS